MTLKIKGDVESARRVIENRPTLNDAPKFIRDRTRKGKNGQPTTDISDKRARSAVWEMIKPSVERQIAHSRKLQAQVATVPVWTPRGEKREVSAHLERVVRAKGFRPAVYYGKTRGRRIERWSDGLLYRECPDGGFEPMHVCCIGTPFIPCKNEACERCNGVTV